MHLLYVVSDIILETCFCKWNVINRKERVCVCVCVCVLTLSVCMYVCMRECVKERILLSGILEYLKMDI